MGKAAFTKSKESGRAVAAKDADQAPAAAPGRLPAAWEEEEPEAAEGEGAAGLG